MAESYVTVDGIYSVAESFSRLRWRQFTNDAETGAHLTDYWQRRRHDVLPAYDIDYKLRFTGSPEFDESLAQLATALEDHNAGTTFGSVSVVPKEHLHMTLSGVPEEMSAEVLPGFPDALPPSDEIVLETAPALHRKVLRAVRRFRSTELATQINVYKGAIVAEIAPEHWQHVLEIARAVRAIPELGDQRPDPFTDPKERGMAPHITLATFNDQVFASDIYAIVEPMRDQALGMITTSSVELALGTALIGEHFALRPLDTVGLRREPVVDLTHGIELSTTMPIDQPESLPRP